MKGQILDYSIQKNAGVISAENGERYKFEGAEWHADMQPTRGASVDFDVENGMAIGIYRSLNSAPSRAKKSSNASHSSAGSSVKSKSTATLLAFLLGGFGTHKFYTGAWGWGLVYLGTFIFSWVFAIAFLSMGSDVGGFFYLLMFLPGLAAFVECFRYLNMSEDDWNEKLSSEPIEPFTFIW